MTLGERIQCSRKKCGLSQEGLAERLGVSRQAVSKWELDAALPEVDKVVALARLFGVSTDELLGNSPPEPEAPPAPAPPHARRFPWYLLGLIPLAVGVFWIARGAVSVATFSGILGAMLSPDSRAAWMEEIPSSFAGALYIPFAAQIAVGAVLAAAGLLVLLLGRRRHRR